MKIFLSYPSEERAVAERLNFSLLALGHDVFFDRDDLAAGLEYDQAIASAVSASDLFVFLITPSSVAPGRYTLTELGLAQHRWPHPSGRVLPVMLRGTPIDSVPSYLRAVSIFTPSGDAVAETAQETQRLAHALPLATQASRLVRSRRGALLAVAALVVAATALWLVRGRASATRDSANAGGRSASRRAAAVAPLPDDIRYRARAVAPAADGGVIVAVTSPNQVVHVGADGRPTGVPVALMGEPVFATRTGTHTLLVTRAPDGVTVLDWRDQSVYDTVRLDASRIAPLPTGAQPATLSSDIQSVAVGSRGMLWVSTREHDGAAAILRFRQDERRWEAPTWSLREQGLVGGDARDLLLRPNRSDLWAVSAYDRPSSLYHMVGFIRIDAFHGRDLPLVSCAHDLAQSPAGNLLFLSCDNELQEVSVDGRTLTVVSSRPTLPRDTAPGVWTDEIIIPDGASAIVALNTSAPESVDRPVHARIVEVDSAGALTSLLDLRNAVVKSMAVTPKMVVAVLQRANGSTDALRIARP
ncbi:MAG TPA: toll/interleukin-1 receptor domain-containing protein [Gemmatimonadaceae bacterium]|nr:toll/interleukin-1 receptor domain-containing protein [Gemmatimonadaceae bacterium]